MYARLALVSVVLSDSAISGGDGADVGGNTVANNDADDDDADGGDGSDAAADRVAPLITRHP